MGAAPDPAPDWPLEVHRVLAGGRVRLVGYVPDAGHARLIELCHASAGMRAVPLTTEEEGIGLVAGAWLGGERSVLLMQSSGVGNLVNALGMVRECRVPVLLLVTMRGQSAEFNPWQVPMGQATPAVLAALGVVTQPVEDGAGVGPAVEAALRLVYDSYAAVAVLVSQRVIGIKSFQEQASR